MKRLTILRHAKSSWDRPDLDDFDRPLNERGWKAARRMGKEMKRRAMRFDLCLASTAARVRETLDGVEETYGPFPFRVQFEQRIYAAATATLLELVRATADEIQSLLLVGHNPGLERLVVELGRDDGEGLRTQAGKGFPTAALAMVEFAADRWSEVERGGEIVELILPRELD